MAYLKGITLENFRVFKEATEFEFAPITLLVGANNSGKSSVLKALLLIKENMVNNFRYDNKSLKENESFDFKADSHQLGSFHLAKNRNLEKDFIKITTLFEYENPKIQNLVQQKIEYTFKENENSWESVYFLDGVEYHYTLNNQSKLKAFEQSFITKYSKLNFDDYDFLYGNLYIMPNERALFLSIFKIDYLEAVRVNQKRFYYYSSQGTQFNNLLGSYQNFMLEISKRTTNADVYLYEQSIARQKFVDKWLHRFAIGEKMILELNATSGGYNVYVIKNGKETNLVDLGFGVAQLLAMLMKIAICTSDYLLIEEAENSLHPSFQSMLADMFVDAYQTLGIRFIIETHSEYIVRKLQYLTAATDIYGVNALKPEDTIIYYFNAPDNIPEGETQVYPIHIQANGRLDRPFGKGFFDEASRLMMDLYKYSH